MISSVLLFALTAAAPQAQQPARLRMVVSDCLDNYATKAGKDRQDVAAFQAGLPAACGAAENAFRTAMIAADVAGGSKRADAEAGVADEIAYFHDEAKEKFLMRGGSEKSADAGKPAPPPAPAATEAPAQTAAITSPPAAAPETQ